MQIKNSLLAITLSLSAVFGAMADDNTITLENLPAPEQNVSAEYPFESRYSMIDGVKIHYVEEGQGDPIVLLHGVPTWSYLYRNIIPGLKSQGRVIALDLPGFGKSGQPKTGYLYQDFYHYFDAFIKQHKLKNITLVVQDAGSVVGLDFAAKNPGLIKGVAMMEAAVPPRVPVNSEADLRPFQILLRTPDKGEDWAIEKNGFIEDIIPMSIKRKLSEQEMNAYRQPFTEKSKRKAILAWPRLIPVAGKPADSYAAINGYANWLKTTDKPILLLKFLPGALIKTPQINWLESNVDNLTSQWIGQGIHYVQESHPKAIASAISQWQKQL